MQSQVEKETRQHDHQVTEVLEPAVPEWACWKVLEWSVAISTWQHHGFARNIKERSRLVSGIEALGGKAKYAEVRPPKSSARSSSPSVALPALKAAPQRALPVTPAYRRAVRDSLMHWLREVAAVKKDLHLPIEQLKQLRTECKEALKRHGDRFITAAQKDPLKPWEE